MEGEEVEVSVITALKWIPRIHCMAEPISYEMSKAELELAEKLKSGEAVEEEEEAGEVDANGEEDMDDEDGLPLSQLQDMQLNEDRLVADDDEEDLGSDAEDHRLLETDKILVTATVQDDQASLEIHVYDTENSSFYVHHDIALPSYPLCLEWVGIRGKEANWTDTKSENFLAVGTFEPHIEIWNLDVLDALEPNARLEGHSDAVMCLAWNPSHPNLLASGSADCTVKIWNLETSQVGRNFSSIHTDKVQSAQWNPAESTVLLTGSFDKSVCVFDARDSEKVARYVAGDSDIESVTWDYHNPVIFGLSTESGDVSFFDVRLGPSALPLVSFQAHEKACSQLCGNVKVPGLYATCSADKTIKVWDLQEEFASSSHVEVAGKVTCKKKTKKPAVALKDKAPIVTKKMKVGKLFSCQFSVNCGDVSLNADPFLISTGGSKGAVALWHIGSAEDEEESKFLSVFGDRVLK